MSGAVKVPPLGEPLEFARTESTGRVHILPWSPGPEDDGWAEPPAMGFAEGLAMAAATPVRTLCGQRLRIALAGSNAVASPGDFIGGDGFTDDDLCIACVRALGDQQWRAFHADNRGSP